MIESRKIKPRIMAVRLNETDFWSGDIGDEIKSIHGHYLYDERCLTHICSIQTYYDLRFVGFDFEPINDDLSDEERDNLHSRILEEYGRECQDDYFLSGRIDKIHDGNRRLFEEADDDTDPDLLEDDAFLRDCSERYQGDPVWS